MHPETFRSFVDEVNRAGGTYHKMDFGQGLVMDGEYAMARYLAHYGLPDDLAGRTVLDVGTASGFFAFECARRGAEVTAIDVHEGGLFDRIRDGLGLDVRYLQKDLFELDPDFGRFDLVVCGSLLLHLRDIVGAMERLRSVCRGEAIVATGIMRDRGKQALLEFLGQKAEGDSGVYWTYWLPSMAALRQMLLAAGFSTAEEISRFVLRSEPGKGGFATPHGVVRARV